MADTHTASPKPNRALFSGRSGQSVNSSAPIRRAHSLGVSRRTAYFPLPPRKRICRPLPHAAFSNIRRYHRCTVRPWTACSSPGQRPYHRNAFCQRAFGAVDSSSSAGILLVPCSTIPRHHPASLRAHLRVFGRRRNIPPLAFKAHSHQTDTGKKLGKRFFSVSR